MKGAGLPAQSRQRREQERTALAGRDPPCGPSPPTHSKPSLAPGRGLSRLPGHGRPRHRTRRPLCWRERAARVLKMSPQSLQASLARPVLQLGGTTTGKPGDLSLSEKVCEGDHGNRRDLISAALFLGMCGIHFRPSSRGTDSSRPYKGPGLSPGEKAGLCLRVTSRVSGELSNTDRQAGRGRRRSQGFLAGCRRRGIYRRESPPRPRPWRCWGRWPGRFQDGSGPATVLGDAAASLGERQESARTARCQVRPAGGGPCGGQARAWTPPLTSCDPTRVPCLPDSGSSSINGVPPPGPEAPGGFPQSLS